MDRRTSQPAARSRQPARTERAAQPSHSAQQSSRSAARSDRVSKLMTQLHYNYSLKAQRLPSSSPAPSSMHVEQRYLQWRDFWLAASSGSGDAVDQQQSCAASCSDRLRDDAAKIERLLAFTNDCSSSGGSAADAAQPRRTSSLPPLTVSSPPAPTDEAGSPHSPAYYANLARFIACAPPPRAFPSRRSHGKRRGSVPPSPPPPQAEAAAATQRSEASHCLSRAAATEGELRREKPTAAERSGDGETASDDGVIEIVIVEQRAEPAAPALRQPAEVEEPAPVDCGPPVSTPSSPAAPPSCCPPLMRPSCVYSFTSLPQGRECIHPEPAAAAAAAASASPSAFSLQSLFTRMSIPQLLRYLSALSPSSLSFTLPSGLSKQQLIHLACSLYRSKRSGLPAAAVSDSVSAQRERVAEEMQRLYGHLPLQVLLQTVLQWEDKTRPPAVRTGAALGAGEQAVERAWRRCMLAVHPDKHAAGSERVLQLRCEELYKLIQSKMADWKRRQGK